MNSAFPNSEERFAEDVVRNCLAEINQPLPPTAQLDHLRLDSLTMILVLISVEEALQIRFPDAEVERIKNLGQFVAVIQRYVKKRPIPSAVQFAKGA